MGRNKSNDVITDIMNFVKPLRYPIIVSDISCTVVDMHTKEPSIYVTVSVKTVLIGTFNITRKTNLKYSSCCGSVVMDFSHARFTV